MTNITLFSQIMTHIPRDIVQQTIQKHSSDKYHKAYNSWTHLVTMIFCHLAKSQSIRDIAFGLRSATGNLNHLGIKKAPSKSSITHQNKHRKSDFFKDVYFTLLTELSQRARMKQRKFRIKSKIYLLDSTLISLSLSLFDWAHYKQTKGAVKLHTLLDYDGVLPAFINITDGKTADNKGAADLVGFIRLNLFVKILL